MLSLSYLYQNVPMKPWPILLMYSDDLDDESKRTEFTVRLYDFLGSDQDARWFIDRLEWIRLEWTLPDGISHDKEVVQPVFADYWPGESPHRINQELLPAHSENCHPPIAHC